jgi:hypothetical protein
MEISNKGDFILCCERALGIQTVQALLASRVGLPRIATMAAQALFMRNECSGPTAGLIRYELKNLEDRGMFSWAGDREYKRGADDGLSRARSRPGDGDMGG